MAQNIFLRRHDKICDPTFFWAVGEWDTATSNNDAAAAERCGAKKPSCGTPYIDFGERCSKQPIQINCCAAAHIFHTWYQVSSYKAVYHPPTMCPSWRHTRFNIKYILLLRGYVLVVLHHRQIGTRVYILKKTPGIIYNYNRCAWSWATWNTRRRISTKYGKQREIVPGHTWVLLPVSQVDGSSVVTQQLVSQSVDGRFRYSTGRRSKAARNNDHRKNYDIVPAHYGFLELQLIILLILTRINNQL